MTNYSLLHKQFLVNTYVNRGIALISGKGMYLYDENKNKYLDCMSNYGVNILGHSHTGITKTLKNQLETLSVLHSSFANDIRVRAAQQLVKEVGRGIASVYFSNSGAEAMEAALKFAAVATGKKRFISCKNSFHGKTLGALSATGEEKYRDPFKPLLWNFTHIDYNDVKALEKNITEDTAAFIVEPIQGEGGIYIPHENYFKEVSKICDEKRILLIIDEIQTGCGRTGRFLASQISDVNYDIVCLGKGLAGGIPVGATLVSEKIAAKITRGVNTSTFGGNPLACAGILETLKLLDEEMLAHVIEMGDYFLGQLIKIKSSLIRDVRGKGLMIGIEVKDKRNDILKALQQEYILTIPAGENVVRLLPPLIIEKKHVDEIVDKLNKVLKLV
ncbi:hypothetical protein A3C28_04575 [Candidatus Roizmanbacteria bacterium RIFCSPHIGHO2_02_FULL_39_9]|uniref:Acetylornithine aminotransferase n=2 Tax=Candidatus Roizmaniibacteriota TaxID=1752723 RepID=A0A1F7HW15_9BACT|nr:MAG: hypothetical protein A3C28_04575 [Candidatus Roizmanbacteria bacterium RIFCSPHIGHO2_02_FULL_39_9]OGK35320.1 MAG: hypothetical protein A3F60_01240 [Candidatus Roizmanbacteria bacterium RIFCSPHIGHO2_12_FULL_39_8]